MTTVRPSTSQKTPTFSSAETFGTILLDIFYSSVVANIGSGNASRTVVGDCRIFDVISFIAHESGVVCTFCC